MRLLRPPSYEAAYAPGGIRTPDQQLRRLPLYPSELLAPAHAWSPSRAPDCDHRSAGTAESGRPDSNRRPPAPKAGAIPGYATPRTSAPPSSGGVSYPEHAPRSTTCRKESRVHTGAHPRVQRREQRAKRATAMTDASLRRPIDLRERRAKIIREKIRIVAEPP